MERAIDLAGADGFGCRDHILRHLFAVWSHFNNVFLEAFPGVAGGPGAIEHSLGGLKVMRTPVVDNCRQLRFGRKGAHVGTLAEAADDAAFGSNLQRSRTVGMLGNDVDALIDHGARSIGFLGRIVPGRDINRLDGEIGIDATTRQRQCIDAHHHFGDRERADVASLAGLRHVPGNGAAHCTAFIEACIVEPDIGPAHVTRRMFESDVGELRGDLDHRIAEAEAGGENQLAALLGQFAQDALGVRAFRHVLDKHRFNAVAELLLDIDTALIMRVVVAVVVDRADIDEADLDLVELSESLGAKERERSGSGTADLDECTTRQCHVFSPG